MTFKKENYTTTLVKAKTLVPGFKEAFSRFEERLVLDRCSKSMFSNYSRNLAHLALHFGRVPHAVSVDEINTYLYRLTVHENYSVSFFKQTVFGQLISLIKSDLVKSAVKTHNSDYYTKKFTTSDHLISMLFSCFANCSSLREVAGAMLGLKGKTNHFQLKNDYTS